jgi:endonuclease/exonuclease/phosphatase family metal-dependent hydrolase
MITRETILPQNEAFGQKTRKGSQQTTSEFVADAQLKIATFNLYNYLEPPYAFYDFEKIYSREQWSKKQDWISAYLTEHQPDVIGFQEVFSSDCLKALVAAQDYPYFQVVDQAQVIDDFIYRSPVVAIASRYKIVATGAVAPDQTIAQTMGLAADFSFSRQVLRATIDLPHIGHVDCYVVHFKSKRSLFDYDNQPSLTAEKNVVEQLKAEVTGGWASSIVRGSEAALLWFAMLNRREQCQLPMVLMGDFNTPLSDGVLAHLTSDRLNFSSNIVNQAFVAKYCLKDAWDLFLGCNNPSPITRKATHYYGGVGSVLDYILLSCEFDANFHASLFEVSDYQVYDRHLLNPIFDRDGQSTDHGVLLITLSLRR